MMEYMKDVTFEKWETERTHRISLSVHDMQVLLDALEVAHTYPSGFYNDCGINYKRIDKRIHRLRNKIMAAHNEGC